MECTLQPHPLGTARNPLLGTDAPAATAITAVSYLLDTFGLAVLAGLAWEVLGGVAREGLLLLLNCLVIHILSIINLILN